MITYGSPQRQLGRTPSHITYYGRVFCHLLKPTKILKNKDNQLDSVFKGCIPDSCQNPRTIESRKAVESVKNIAVG